MKYCLQCGAPLEPNYKFCRKCGARLADLGHTQTKGNKQRQKRGFKMQKCPLCDKKIREDSKFCSECGWDLTDHELTPLQMARIQEEIQDARFRAMRLYIGTIQFLTIGLVCNLVAMFAIREVIPARWDFTLYVFPLFYFIAVVFSVCEYRYKKKQDRLKMMLRDRQSSQ